MGRGRQEDAEQHPGHRFASGPGPRIRHRSDRYPGATGIEPEWTLEAAKDPRRIVRDPDPKSQTGAVRLIGYSPSARFMFTVIIDPVDQAGITAWKTRGADLRDYLGGRDRP